MTETIIAIQRKIRYNIRWAVMKNFMQQKELKNVGVIAKKIIKDHIPLLKETVHFLKKHKKNIYFNDGAAEALGMKKGIPRANILKKVDIAIVLGGDGTILKTARSLCYNPVLILGVNIGRVGFLTEVAPQKIHEALERVFVKKRFLVDQDFILRVTVYRKNKKIKTSLALNDVVINQGAFARLIDLRTEINQRKVAHFRADGLIVSTPTGSTGHALSAGGPIVHSDLDAFIITPICPVSLADRPIVIPNDRQIKILIETERRGEQTELGLTIDGQESFQLKYGDEIKIRKSGREAAFIRLSNAHYYKCLRTKLKWGA